MIKKSKIIPVILSGGSGTRLWPLSRKASPKQFINLIDNESLFFKTAKRVMKDKVFTDYETSLREKPECPNLWPGRAEIPVAYSFSIQNRTCDMVSVGRDDRSLKRESIVRNMNVSCYNIDPCGA